MVERLLEALQGEMSRGQRIKQLRLKDRMHFGTEYLQPSLAAGLIEMTIPDKPRSRMVRWLRNSVKGTIERLVKR